jgi:hypothetical protein
VIAWWRDLRGGDRPYETEYLALQEAMRASQRLITCEPNDVHARLLAHRMERLGIGARDLARADPLLFRELQATCLLCEKPEACAHALRDNTADPAWQEWRDYCPNSTRLSVLATLQGCDEADAENVGPGADPEPVTGKNEALALTLELDDDPRRRHA